MKTVSPFNKMLYSFMLFIGMLILFRTLYAGSLRYISMIWNIFLAWIPYVLGGFFTQYRLKAKWKQVILFATWLLFFPNALYIITDLVHLQDETTIPWWFDAALLFASSFVGIVMAFVSLQKTEVYLRSYFNHITVGVLMALVLFLGSFGVYLGRFERWNSWDVLNDPFALSVAIVTKIINPVDNYRAWAITILFSGIYAMMYYFIKTLPQALAATRKPGQ